MRTPGPRFGSDICSHKSEPGEQVSLDVDVAGYIGSCEAEFVRSPQQPPQAPAFNEIYLPLRARGSRSATVPASDLDRHVRAHSCANQWRYCFSDRPCRDLRSNLTPANAARINRINNAINAAARKTRSPSQDANDRALSDRCVPSSH